MRRIGVVTVGRSDYGILYPVLRAIQAEPELQLQLIVSGAHLSQCHGSTITEIERDGFEIAARVRMLLSDDSPESVSMSMGIGVVNFASAYKTLRPDILLILGDRFEALSAAVSALPLRIPIAHIHGGELTQGAMDDAIRHAITKLSHIHFAAAPEYAQRIKQMGEQPDRVFVTGSPVVDSIQNEEPLSLQELEKSLGVPVQGAMLVTYHPQTLQHERTEERISTLLDVLAKFENHLLFTYPNADMDNAVIINRILEFADRHHRAHVFVNLGRRKYHSLQRYVAAMVGNSSSGIIEAASFQLPVVNIGDRQKGRLRTPNIVDVPDDSIAIAEAIRRALSKEFRSSVAAMKSPYGVGDSSQKIVKILKSVVLDGSLLQKKFCDSMQVERSAGSPDLLSVERH